MEASAPTPADRCGKCEFCLHVEKTKRIAMPNPPFSHATTGTVVMWNQVLYDNPCETWDESAKAAYKESIRRGVRMSVKPRRT